ncbi:MAG TPA: heavy-metal-associated domain-containing protein [Pantanalinema sp.]
MLHHREVSFFVEDITCKTCVRRIIDGLRALDGAIAVRASSAPFEEGTGTTGLGVVTVKYNPEFISHCRLKEVLENDLGFKVAEIREEGQVIRG